MKIYFYKKYKGRNFKIVRVMDKHYNVIIQKIKTILLNNNYRINFINHVIKNRINHLHKKNTCTHHHTYTSQHTYITQVKTLNIYPCHMYKGFLKNCKVFSNPLISKLPHAMKITCSIFLNHQKITLQS